VGTHSHPTVVEETSKKYCRGIKIATIHQIKKSDFIKYRMSRILQIIVALSLLSIFIGCPKSNITGNFPSNANFVVDTLIPSISIEAYHDSVRWARVYCIVKYHYTEFSGTLENLSFTYLEINSDFDNKPKTPDPENVFKRWDGGFWIRDSLINIDTATINLTLRGLFYHDTLQSEPIGTFTSKKTMRIPIIRSTIVPGG